MIIFFSNGIKSFNKFLHISSESVGKLIRITFSSESVGKLIRESIRHYPHSD